MRLSITTALLALGAVAACSKTEPAPEPVRAVQTLVVAPQTAGGSYEFAGEVKARVESILSFRVGGKMLSRAVNLGDAVKAGQVLARLDPADLRLGQEAANANTRAAEANYEQAASDYKRYKDLRDQGFISTADLERRDMALKTAKAQLDQAKAQGSVQLNQAAYAALVADAAGVVTGVDAEPGAVVGAGSPVVRIARDGPRDVVFSVPEDKVGLVKSLIGQPDRLQLRLWGAEKEPLATSIREVSAAADPATRTFQVKADIGAGSRAVRLGQTATVTLTLPQTASVTKLPLSALKEEQGRTVVWLVDRGSMTVKEQPVQIAGADGNDAIVTNGLAPGQIVVTAGVHVLNPGQKVRLYVDPGAPPSSAAAGVPVTVK